MVAFAVGEVALFSINAVVNAAVMWSVPVGLRSLACSMATIALHVLGDVPATPIIGALQDHLNAARGKQAANWRTTLSVAVSALLLACWLFGTAALVALRAQRRRGGGEVGDGDGGDGVAAEAPSAPLLGAEAGEDEDASARRL